MARTFVDTDWGAFAGQRPEFANAERIWTNVLEPELAKRESERTRLLSAAISRAAMVGIPLLIVGSFLVFWVIAIFIAMAGAAISAAIPMVKLYGFKTGVKDLVLSSAAESFGFSYDTLHHDVSGINSWAGIKDFAMREAEKATEKSKLSGLFSQDLGEDAPTPAFPTLKAAGLMPSHDNRKFEDRIEGERAGAKFSLVECKLTDERGSGNNKQTVTVFEGILLHIAYPQRFLGRTLLARSGTWKWGKRSWKDLEEVKLVSIELDKAFTVYSNDQVEARAILTPDKMERLIALERFFEGGKLRGIFEDDHLTVALEAGDQFEVGSYFESLINPAHYRKALFELGLVCDLIDGFLTREWMQDKI